LERVATHALFQLHWAAELGKASQFFLLFYQSLTLIMQSSGPLLPSFKNKG
jgi:hypothetical protein